jgi:hypothetical protein
VVESLTTEKWERLKQEQKKPGFIPFLHIVSLIYYVVLSAIVLFDSKVLAAHQPSLTPLPLKKKTNKMLCGHTHKQEITKCINRNGHINLA